EDRHALEGVHGLERGCAHPDEPAPRRRQRPLPAGVALHLDTRARRRRGEPGPRRLLVQVVGLELEHVDLGPGNRQELLAALGTRGAALVARPSAAVADVVPPPRPHQRGGRRVGSAHRAGLHRIPRRTFSLMAIPLAPRWTASTSAMMLRAISGADWAPRSR